MENNPRTKHSKFLLDCKEWQVAAKWPTKGGETLYHGCCFECHQNEPHKIGKSGYRCVRFIEEHKFIVCCTTGKMCTQVLTLAGVLNE